MPRKTIYSVIALMSAGSMKLSVPVTNAAGGGGCVPPKKIIDDASMGGANTSNGSEPDTLTQCNIKTLPPKEKEANKASTTFEWETN